MTSVQESQVVSPDSTIAAKYSDGPHYKVLYLPGQKNDGTSICLGSWHDPRGATEDAEQRKTHLRLAARVASSGMIIQACDRDPRSSFNVHQDLTDEFTRRSTAGIFGYALEAAIAENEARATTQASTQAESGLLLNVDLEMKPKDMKRCKKDLEANDIGTLMYSEGQYIEPSETDDELHRCMNLVGITSDAEGFRFKDPETAVRLNTDGTLMSPTVNGRTGLIKSWTSAMKTATAYLPN